MSGRLNKGGVPPIFVSMWWIYMIRAVDGALYTGVTTDVSRRLNEHRDLAPQSRGSKFLKGRGPIELVLTEKIGDKILAHQLEYRLKRLSKVAKEEIVARQFNREDLLHRVSL